MSKESINLILRHNMLLYDIKNQIPKHELKATINRIKQDISNLEYNII